MIKYLKNYYQTNSATLLFSVVFFIVALIVFAVISSEVILGKEAEIDHLVFDFFHKYMVRDQVTDSMHAITQFASTDLMKIVYPAVMVILVLFKKYQKAMFSFATGAGGLLLIYTLKLFFKRERPANPLLYKEESFSFPSGHATFSFIFYGTLAYLIWLTDLPKMWKYMAITFLVSLSFAIGFSRIYLHVHYASDVIGGFCLGYCWLLLMIYSFRKWVPLN